MRSRAWLWFGTKGQRVAPDCVALVRVEPPLPRIDVRAMVLAYFKAQMLKAALDSFRSRYFIR